MTNLFRQRKTFGQTLTHLFPFQSEKNKLSEKNSQNNFRSHSPFEWILNRFFEKPEVLKSNYEQRFFKKNNLSKRSEKQNTFYKNDNTPQIVINKLNNLGVGSKNCLTHGSTKILGNLKKDDLKENNSGTANQWKR